MQFQLTPSKAFSLYPHQTVVIGQLRQVYAEGHRAALLQAATGFGKTRVAAEIMRSAAVRAPVLFLAHLDALLDDTAERLRTNGLFIGPGTPVHVRSTQSLHRRQDLPPANLVILDEAHRAQGPTVRALIDAYPDAKILGLTATPQRGDGQPLGDVFTAMVSGPSTRWLTTNGFLVPVDVVAPPDVQEQGLIATPLDAYRRWTPEGRAIVFCQNVAHATETALTFKDSACLTGDTPIAVRRSIRARLASGELKVLTSVYALNEGFDWPACDTVILARSFGVTGTFLQCVGRGMRSVPGKRRCTVLDLKGSVYLHGLPDEERQWNLDGTAVRRTETLPALQTCKGCGAIFRPSTRCPRCGAACVAAARVPRVLNRAEKLARLEGMSPVERDRRYLERLETIATTRIRMPTHRARQWAIERFKATRGRDPVTA